MTVSQARLNALMEAIGGHEKAEVEFFRALLDAIVYAHVPPSDDSGRLRFIQFIAPEGDTLLPFFTDQAKADFAARGHAKVVAMTGRELFSITLGATLIMNPNDRWCRLYPHELLALLQRGDMPPVDQTDLSTHGSVGFTRPAPLCQEDMRALRDAVANVGHVRKAFLADLHTDQSENPETALAVIVPKEHDERVCRSLVAVLRGTSPKPGFPSGVMALNSAEDLPDGLETVAILLYDAAAGLN